MAVSAYRPSLSKVAHRIVSRGGASVRVAYVGSFRVSHVFVCGVLARAKRAFRGCSCYGGGGGRSLDRRVNVLFMIVLGREEIFGCNVCQLLWGFKS